MTRQDKIEAIRTACVKANPNKDFRYCWECDEGAKARLADVLNAIMHTERIVCIASNERFEVLNKDTNQWEPVFRVWCLTADDLTQQSDETIDFLYSLLYAKQ